jgi:hypothetical protein
MGKNLWDVDQDQISYILELYWVLIFLYGTCRMTSRISIMLFYFRILRNVQSGRWLRWTILVLDATSCLGLILLNLFTCQPVSYYWTRWDGEQVGSCVNLPLEIRVIGIKDIIFDVIIIAMPLPYIAQLQLSLKKRLMSAVLFSIGIVIVVVSGFRLTTIDAFATSSNPTIDGLGVASISFIEVSLGIMCACLPSIRPLFKPLEKRIFGRSSKGDSSGGAGGGGGRYAQRTFGGGEFQGATSYSYGKKKHSITTTTVSGGHDASEDTVALHAGAEGCYYQLGDMESSGDTATPPGSKMGAAGSDKRPGYAFNEGPEVMHGVLPDAQRPQVPPKAFRR